MAGKKYLVAEFSDNSIEVIPRSWVTGPGADCAFWPSHYSQKKIERAILTLEDPGDMWKKCTINRIMAASDSYSKARRKASEALFISNVSDSSNYFTEKRTSRCPERYRNSGNEDGSASSKNPFHGVILLESGGEVDTHENIPQLHMCTPQRPSLPQFPEQGGSSVSSHSTGNMHDITLSLFKSVEGLRYEVKELRKQVGILMAKPCCHNVVQGRAAALTSTLPVASQEELTELCTEIVDSAKMTRLVEILASAGGLHTSQIVCNVMRLLMANEVCKQYSCCGRKGKNNFSSLLVYKAVEEAVLRCAKSTTLAEVRLRVSRYLAGASDREGGRSNRKK